MLVLRAPFIKRAASDTTYVSDAHKDRNYCGSDWMRVGFDGCGTFLGLLKFENPGCFEDIYIDRAMLLLYARRECFTDVCHSYGRVAVYQNSTDFSECAAVWLNRPEVMDGRRSMAEVSGAARGAYVCADITEMARAWCGGEEPNYGVTVAPAGRSLCGSLLFDSRRGANPPLLCIEYGTSCRPCECDNPFSQRIYHIDSADEVIYSPTAEIEKARVVSFFIQNLGEASIRANIEISPDGAAFIDEAQESEIAGGGITALVPYVFARFIRVRIRSAEGVRTRAKIWLQTQKDI